MDQRTRKLIEDQTDPRLLRGLLIQANEYIEEQKKLIDRLQKEAAEKAQAGFVLEERTKLLSQALYGKSSEQRLEATDRPRDPSTEAAQIFAQSAFPSEEKREEPTGKAKGKELDEVTFDHFPSDEVLVVESRSRGVTDPKPNDWVDTGLFDTVTKIQIIERRYVRELHRRHKMKLRSEVNPDPDKDVIITAAVGPELLPGMNYTTEFVASVVADKYISHMPLERQTREMESLGLKGMKNSTLSRFCALAATHLEPMQEEILKEDLLLSDLALHLDETPWKIQNKHEEDGYMWVVSNHRGSYYFFRPTRSGEVLKAVLGDYKGPALTDGFSGYNILAELGIPQAFCWAHARREFYPLETHDPTVKPILDLIDELFAIDREARDFVHLEELRHTKSSIAIETLKLLLMAELPRSRPGSQKRKAIDYTLKRWDGLTIFLISMKVPLSNNEAERTIRHAVVGRKNYYGSGSHTGAATAATLFTVIESCKKNDLDPRSFLLMSLHRSAAGEPLETPLAYARRTRALRPTAN